MQEEFQSCAILDVGVFFFPNFISNWMANLINKQFYKTFYQIKDVDLHVSID